MSKVSIIVPIYNVEKYLIEALDSVVNQTYKDLEIICVNDGSKDNSRKILEEYKNKDSRIIIVDQENQGLAGARNSGLNIASGEYIYFMDSDDYIKSDLVELNVDIMKKYSPDLICFGSDISGVTDSNLLKYINPEFKGLYLNSKKNIFKTNIHVWNKFYKKELLDAWNLKFCEGLLFEDIYFNFIYFLRATKLYYLQDKLYTYRVRENSIMNDNKSFKSLDHLKNIENLLDYFKDKKDLWNKKESLLYHILDIYYIRTLKTCTNSERTEIIKYQESIIYKKFLEILNVNNRNIVNKSKYVCDIYIRSLKLKIRGYYAY